MIEVENIQKKKELTKFSYMLKNNEKSCAYVQMCTRDTCIELMGFFAKYETRKTVVFLDENFAV